MELLSEIAIEGKGEPALIQLLHGDLTALPPEHAVDILVVSAYPGNYGITDKKTLIAGLSAKGISVEKMAADKETDMVASLSCWLSRPLDAAQQAAFNFRKILCFEPSFQSVEPETAVGNIFRCINSIAFDRQNNVIAMPVLGSGNQRIPMEKMLPAILENAIFWLKNGLPLTCIKLVLYTEEQVKVALPIFNEVRDAEEPEIDISSTSRGLGADAVSETVDNGYDFFISYAHKNTDLVNGFVKDFLDAHNTLNIFYDRSSIPAGGMWIKQISDAIQKAKKVIIFLSPDYTNSPVCWDEFQCAKLIEYNRKTSVIQTVYLHDYAPTEMPPIMAIYSWLDCREGDTAKLKSIVSNLMK